MRLKTLQLGFINFLLFSANHSFVNYTYKLCEIWSHLPIKVYLNLLSVKYSDLGSAIIEMRFLFKTIPTVENSDFLV